MPTVDIRDQLGLAKNEDLFKHLRILVYGDPNAGKTHFCGTTQDDTTFFPTLHLGFEQGLLSVAYRENYDKMEIRSIDKLEKTFALLYEDQQKSEPYYKSYSIDNATSLQNMDMDFVMNEALERARLRGKEETVDKDVPSQREWGKIGKRLRRVVSAFRDLPMHSLWTAWRAEYTDEDTNITYTYPKLSGHMKTELAGYFDIVGLLTVGKPDNEGNVKRFLQIQGTERTTAKWRNRNFETVPGIIEEPTIPEIWKLVQTCKIARK